MTFSWSGQRVLLKQEDILGQLHIAKLGRVRAAASYKVPKAWKTSQGCLRKGEIYGNAAHCSLFVFQFFSPVQNKQSDIIVAPLSPVKSYLYQPLLKFLSSVLTQSHLIGNPFKGFRISLVSWKTAGANFYLLLDNINFLSFLLIFLAFQRSLTRPTSKLNR